MLKILAVPVAVALINAAAIPAGNAATHTSSTTISAPGPKDLGVPRKRTLTVRIINSDVGHETKIAYFCTYQYAIDAWGNYVYRIVYY
jgi:hypothetical protein